MQSEYRVNENGGVVQPALVLSKSSSSNITIQMISTDITTSGEHHIYKLNTLMQELLRIISSYVLQQILS